MELTWNIFDENGDPGGDPFIEIRLSRRNLESLLAKLNGFPPESFCTIQGNFNGMRLIVKAEQNDVHYGGRTPGRMHPATEDHVERFKPFIDAVRNAQAKQ